MPPVSMALTATNVLVLEAILEPTVTKVRIRYVHTCLIKIYKSKFQTKIFEMLYILAKSITLF